MQQNKSLNKDYIIQPSGDHAVTVYFGDSIDERTNKKVLQFAALLKRHAFEGILDIIPAYASVTVVYDTLQLMAKVNSASAFVTDQLHHLLKQENAEIQFPSRSIRIPVCYDISLGIDLEEIAAKKNMSINAIIAFHSSVKYRVYMLGFLPGFSYMGTVHEEIVMPRKAAPRQLVAAGSVGIAGAQTGIYPLDAPGGWNIIGRTPLKMFDKKNDQPCLLQPGDEVVFEPISLEEFEKIKNQQ